MTHNFLDEIQEDLERQKLEAFWKKYGIVIIGAALAIVLATAASSAYRTWKVERDQRLTMGLLDAAAVEPGKALQQMVQFADANNGSTQAVLARMHAGSTAVEQGDKAQAIKLFDEVAKDSSANESFRQLADLYSVQLQMDEGDAKALFERLTPLTAEKAAWRYSAMESQGYLAIRMKDQAKAVQIFTSLSQDARAPRGIASRASDVLRSLN